MTTTAKTSTTPYHYTPRLRRIAREVLGQPKVHFPPADDGLRQRYAIFGWCLASDVAPGRILESVYMAEKSGAIVIVTRDGIWRGISPQEIAWEAASAGSKDDLAHIKSLIAMAVDRWPYLAIDYDEIGYDLVDVDNLF